MFVGMLRILKLVCFIIWTDIANRLYN